MDIFFNQLIQFYSNNATNLHHLTSPVLPRNMETTDYCGVSLPYVLLRRRMTSTSVSEICDWDSVVLMELVYPRGAPDCRNDRRIRVGSDGSDQISDQIRSVRKRDAS